MKNTQSFLILFGIVLLVVGIVVGVLFGKIIPGSPSQKVNNTAKILNSKLIPYINAFGEIVEISGRELTMSYVGDVIAITIEESAEITVIKDNEQEDINFTDLKVGDFVNVNLRVLDDGSVVGDKVLRVEMERIPASGV